MIRRPALILTLLTGLNLLNYLDRYVVSAVIGPLQRDLHLSNFAGGILWSIFLIGYTATSPVFGHLGDKAGHGGMRKTLVAAGVAVWGAATVASGLARGAWSLLAARATVGVGEASYATLAPTLIDDVAPPAKATGWMAIFASATPIGAALGYIVGGAVLHASGWRAAFFVAGGPGLLLAALCLLIVEPARAPRTPQRIADAGRALVRVPLYRVGVLGYCAFTFAIGGFAHWAPTYVHERYGLEAGRASQAFGLITVVGGAIGTLVGGWLGDWRVRRANLKLESSPRPVQDEAVARAHLALCAMGSAIGAPLCALAISASTPTAFLALALAAQIALFSGNGPINLALLRSAPPELRASAMAVAIFAIHALGDLWSPPLIGLVADHAPRQIAMYAVPLVLALAAFVWARASRASGWLTEGLAVR